MKLDDLRRQLAAAVRDNEDLRWLGRNLGRWLAGDVPDAELRTVAAALARPERRCDVFARGYRAALADAAASGARARDERAEQADASGETLPAEVKATWRQVILALDVPERLHAQKDLGLVQTVASRVLERMRDDGLVERVAIPGADQRRRFHRLTPAGRALAERLRRAGAATPPPVSSDQVAGAMRRSLDPARA